jgi:hypothetical protein
MSWHLFVRSVGDEEEKTFQNTDGRRGGKSGAIKTPDAANVPADINPEPATTAAAGKGKAASAKKAKIPERVRAAVENPETSDESAPVGKTRVPRKKKLAAGSTNCFILKGSCALALHLTR